MTALEEALSLTIGQEEDGGDDDIKKAMARLLILLIKKVELGEGSEEGELAKEIGKKVFEKSPSRNLGMIPSPS